MGRLWALYEHWCMEELISLREFVLRLKAGEFGLIDFGRDRVDYIRIKSSILAIVTFPYGTIEVPSQTEIQSQPRSYFPVVLDPGRVVLPHEDGKYVVVDSAAGWVAPATTLAVNDCPVAMGPAGSPNGLLAASVTVATPWKLAVAEVLLSTSVTVASTVITAGIRHSK